MFVERKPKAGGPAVVKSEAPKAIAGSIGSQPTRDERVGIGSWFLENMGKPKPLKISSKHVFWNRSRLVFQINVSLVCRLLKSQTSLKNLGVLSGFCGFLFWKFIDQTLGTS